MPAFENPMNPVELASIRAEASTAQGFEMTPADEKLLAELDFGATELGFLNQSYYIQAHRAMAVPISFEASEPVRYHNFMGLTLEGTFVTYSKIHIGALAGIGAVRAVCLAFKDVLLLPGFDTLPETDLLYVPVLAVSEISQTS